MPLTMSSSFLNPDRKKAAETICASPQLYKVCVGCESVLNRRLHHCPFCQSYHFDESAEAVIAHAKLLAEKPATMDLPIELT